MTRYLPLLLALSACASESGTPLPTQCSKDAVSGTYKLEYSKESGNCNTPPTSLVKVGTPDTTGCQKTNETYSEGDCKQETVFMCPDGLRITQIFRQITSDGSRMEGTQSIAGPCNGLFRVVGTRQ